jgi:DNA helicase-2/ATP-dependent DNA helicase PcrA
MTIHASKGLEFKQVYVVGMEENLFPSQLSLNSRSELEEERRLFYVALTRAMLKLTLSFATSRFKFGTMINSEPSRFLQEIDPQYLHIEGMINRQQEQPTRNTGNYGKPQYGYAKKTPEAALPTVTIPKNFKPINKAIPTPTAIDPNFIGDDTSNLIAGQLVEHARFGNGTVLNTEGV